MIIRPETYLKRFRGRKGTERKAGFFFVAALIPD
jgi:hypothetical protein